MKFMGQTQPAKDEILVTWMDKDKARLDHGEDTSIIVRLDKKMMYMIKHAEMKYREMPISETSDILSSAISGADLSDEEKAQAQKMMKGFAQMMQPNVSVTETGEKQKIKDWKCTKYIMTMKLGGGEGGDVKRRVVLRSELNVLSRLNSSHSPLMRYNLDLWRL